MGKWIVTWKEYIYVKIRIDHNFNISVYNIKNLSYIFRRQGSANESTSARSIPKGFWREFHKDAAVLAPESCMIDLPF